MFFGDELFENLQKKKQFDKMQYKRKSENWGIQRVRIFRLETNGFQFKFAFNSIS